MSSWTPPDDVRRRIFEEEIVPVVFGGRVEPSGQPTLLLLGGQPGAGMSQAAGQLSAEHGGMVALRGDDLGSFHPHYEDLTRSRSVDARQVMAESTAEWLRDCLAHARTTKRSLLLEGTFHTPRVALGTAALFAKEGFMTRVAVVATPRSESLLSATSRYLRDFHAGRSAKFTSLDIHDRGWAGTRNLIAELEASPSVDRVTILGRDGETIFDSTRDAAIRFSGASRTLRQQQSAPMTPARTMQWLSELRAVTVFAMDRSPTPKPVAELLAELHQIALREVVPATPLPATSTARPDILRTLERRLSALQRGMRSSTGDVAAPSVSPASPSQGPLFN